MQITWIVVPIMNVNYQHLKNGTNWNLTFDWQLFHEYLHTWWQCSPYRCIIWLKSYTLRLNTTNSARNLGFIFGKHLTFSDKYLHYPNPAILTFVNFAVSAPILISKLPIPSPPPLSTLNLTTVTHYILYYITIYLPYSQLIRLQRIQNCLARAVFKPP